MRIDIQGQFKSVLFREFVDDEGVSQTPNSRQNPKDVGQKLVDFLLSSADGAPDFVEFPDFDARFDNRPFKDEMDTGNENDRLFLKKLSFLVEHQILRYSKIDMLYWFEVQNRSSDLL